MKLRNYSLVIILAFSLPPSYGRPTITPSADYSTATLSLTAQDMLGLPRNSLYWVAHDLPGAPWAFFNMSVNGSNYGHGVNDGSGPKGCSTEITSAAQTIASQVNGIYPRRSISSYNDSVKFECPTRGGYWVGWLDATNFTVIPPTPTPSCSLSVPPSILFGNQSGTFNEYRSILGTVSCTTPTTVRVRFASKGSIIEMGPSLSGELQVNRRPGNARIQVVKQSNVEIGVNLQGANAAAGSYSKSAVVTMTIE